MNVKKLILSSLIFVILIALTFYTIFSNCNINDVVIAFKSINAKYIIIASLLVIVYFSCQSIYMMYLLKTLNVTISFFKGFFYSVVEFFFSAITPSSTGGQPVQLYFMTKDKIPMRKSMIVLLFNTIIFKVFLILGAILIAIFKPSYIFDNGMLISILFWFGFVFDILATIACFVAMYNQTIVKKFLNLFYSIRNKFSRKKIKYDKKIKETIESYTSEANYYKNHKKQIFYATIITFIQRASLFAILYVIYRGLGFNQYNLLEVIALQIVVQLTIEGIILPGGVGLSEYVGSRLFIILFGNLNIIGMLLNRTLTFYLPLLIIMITIIVVFNCCYINKKD